MTMAQREYNVTLLFQWLELQGANNIVAPQIDADKGVCCLTCCIWEVGADAMDYPLPATKLVWCKQIWCHVRDLAVLHYLKELVDLNVLVQIGRCGGGGFLCGLKQEFINKGLKNNLNVPEPPFCYMYPGLKLLDNKEEGNKA